MLAQESSLLLLLLLSVVRLEQKLKEREMRKGKGREEIIER